MTAQELRALASRYAQTDPRPGTDWRESETGEEYRIVIKPMDPTTFAAQVCYNQSGEPIYCCTLERFTEEVTLPDGSRKPRFEPIY